VRRLLFWMIALLGTACLPQTAAPEDIALPTLYPTLTAPIELEDAVRVGIAYLDAWQRQDFDIMYSLLSFNSQELIAPSDFEALYTESQNEMTFDRLSFQIMSAARMGSAPMVQMVYDVRFETTILGDFDDTDRTLTIIRDPRTDDWRVAWSAGDIFAEMANGARLDFAPQVPSRANIYDRNGDVLADMNISYVIINVVQRRAPNWSACVATLAEALDSTPTRVTDRLNRVPPDWVMTAGVIDQATYRTYETDLNDHCDPTYDSQPVRRYMTDAMSHILGHIGYPTAEQLDDLIRQGFNAETMIGQAGIERSWNETLSGTPGGRLSIVGTDGSRLRVLAEAPSQISESIWLTIDRSLQEYIADALAETYAQSRDAGGWGTTSPGASVVMMDVNTGEILAMVSYPTYDNDALNPFPAIGRATAQDIIADINADDRRPLLNRPAQGVYPTGSIFKVVDSVAALDSGMYETEQDYYCNGTWTYEDDTRYDWWGPGHGRVTTRSALRQSCNPFYYEIGFRMNNIDPFLLPEYARRMGLGQRTGLDELSEASGLIPDPDLIRVNYGRPWTYSDAVNLAIGQGEMGATPLQITRMYAAIANGGLLMEPHLVRERGILNERTITAEPVISSRFDVQARALDEVRQGLCEVVASREGTTGGTAWHIFHRPDSPLLDIGVCGKTGTAQTGRPDPEHSWFAAYAPARAPEVAIVVMVENSGDGSAVAAPITKRILEYYFFLRDD
jgi:penicillin-binding protein 2